MDLTTRRLDDDDAEASRRMGHEAFGIPTDPLPPATLDRPGMTWFGAFVGDELVARMVDRAYDSWYGGVAVPTCGIAGVTVAAEHRGQGALGPLFADTLRNARDRGAVLSTLFPTAPGIYRRFGYELIAEFVTVELATQALAAVRRPTSVRTRRATAADTESIQQVYETWASTQNGPLTRRGPSFSDVAADLFEGGTRVSVAVDADGQICGYATWNRGQGYGEGTVLQVDDLLATNPDAYRALLTTIGSFATVTPLTRIDTSGDDLVRLFLPSLAWQVVHSSPYMLKVVDVVGALTARGYARVVQARLRFALRGDVLAENDGAYELDVSDGTARCTRVPEADRVLTPRGLALLFAGAQSSANLRTAGHLIGGDPAEDQDWDAVFGGRQLHIRDYF